MLTIGIIGANGQVGSEVCLFLSQMSGIRVIPICRTPFASTFLRRCGLECRHGSVETEEAARSLLADCNLVADFSIPRGLPSETCVTTSRILTCTIQELARNGRFCYISSIMAFGMKKQFTVIKNHLLAHTAYGALKRHGERLALRLGKQTRKDIYILRLGQVHGELQTVSQKIGEELVHEAAYVYDSPSYTVFAFTIAEALANIAMGKERPGLYTMVSAPEWKWTEVYQWCVRRHGVHSRIVPVSIDGQGNVLQWFSIPHNAIKRFVLDPLARMALHHADAIAGLLLAKLPALERRSAAMYYRRAAVEQIAQRNEQKQHHRLGSPFTEPIPGRRLQTLSDSRVSMEVPASIVRKLLQRAMTESPEFSSDRHTFNAIGNTFL